MHTIARYGMEDSPIFPLIQKLREGRAAITYRNPQSLPFSPSLWWGDSCESQFRRLFSSGLDGQSGVKPNA
jgi:hypothetical protein